MKKLTTYLLPLVILLLVKTANAQQNSLFNTYSLDPLQLNIAYAGAACTEANVHYRTQWIGLKEAPKLIQLNAHTALGKSNALGLRVNQQTQGLLNTLSATIGYSYRFKISETAKVHLGIGIGWSQAALNAKKAIVIDGATDVTLNNGNRQTANGFDSEFGAMVIGKKIKAGISALHLYNSSPDFSGTAGYKTLPQLNSQVSYVFNKDKKIEVEPHVLNRFTIKGDNIIEGTLNVHFMKMLTIGAGYRSGYGMMALVGAKIGNIKLGYSFDYGVTKNATNLGTSHQVMLGFSMCKTAKTPTPKEETVVAVPTPTNFPTVEEVKEDPKKEEVKKDEVVVKEEPKIEPIKEDMIPQMNAVAEEVVFDLNKSTLNEEGLKKIDDIAKLMVKDPTLKINIIGHACNKGSKETNELLSIRRATYVRAQLIKRGVNPDNIDRSIGVGAEKELFDNNSENQPKNRTVRFESVK